ncbi:MAG: ATP-binding cassette domain-containing protein [Balneolaceae bacterium]|nr:ATP-binding cassette domain-containing protein [Balneolaceae bacterium]
MLEAKNITKQFGSEKVLCDLNLQLREEETLSILGRSGCGKTTLLRILGGLEHPDRGTVLLDGNEIRDQKPERREIVYMHQEAMLFPHLSVFENIAFGLRLRKEDKKRIASRTREMIGQLELEGMDDKMPHQLSGGQKQRVSFGRAIIINPGVLLLDEPFGNLDADTRSSMQELFKRLARTYRITAIFVTHSVKEAILMGDRVSTLAGGSLTTYDSVGAFVRSGGNRVQEEIEFWRSISTDK